MKTAIVIPARFSSSRLPGKPLLRKTGKYLIQHVYEQALQAHADEVIVATDDQRIMRAVAEFGGKAVMTADHHQSGTDRVAEVARHVHADIIVNLQGDEPLIEPETLDLLPHLLKKDENADVATLAVPIRSIEHWRDPNCVKVVRDRTGRALYFSRSPIPYVRDGQPDFVGMGHQFLQHLGLYAYRRAFLMDLATQPIQPLEQMEKLEQLRVLALGYRIQVGIVTQAAKGVDTPADYESFVEEYQRHQLKGAA